MKLFAVIRTRGAAWDPARSLENQDEWNAHAAFMNALTAEGFVVLGGTLDGTPDVLLIVRAESPAEIADRLKPDPWTERDLLRISRLGPWSLRLGALP